MCSRSWLYDMKVELTYVEKEVYDKRQNENMFIINKNKEEVELKLLGNEIFNIKMNQNIYYEKMEVNETQILTKMVARLTSQIVTLDNHMKAEEKPK